MSCFSDTLCNNTTFKTPKTQVGLAQSQSVLYKMHHKTKNKRSQSRFSSTKVQEKSITREKKNEKKKKHIESVHFLC